MVLDDLLAGLRALFSRDEQKVRCPRCKKEIPLSAVEGECPSCGLPLKHYFRVTCPACKAQIPPHARACPSCGLRFSKTSYRCPICGFQFDTFMTECPSCGTKFL